MSVAEPPSNPFAVGNAVGGTPYFVGRIDIIHKVVSVLRRPLEPGLVLFGQRRIGKSSILRELEDQLPKLGPWKPVFFDLQRHTRASIEEIIEELRRGDVPCIRGDASDPEVLRSAGAERAQLISSTIRRPRESHDIRSGGAAAESLNGGGGADRW